MHTRVHSHKACMRMCTYFAHMYMCRVKRIKLARMCPCVGGDDQVSSVSLELGLETDLLGYHAMLPNLLNLGIKTGQKSGK